MKFCVCGRGCSDILSIIRCNDNSRLGNTSVNNTNRGDAGSCKPAINIPNDLPTQRLERCEYITEKNSSRLYPFVSGPISLSNGLLVSNPENSNGIEDIESSSSPGNAVFSPSSRFKAASDVFSSSNDSPANSVNTANDSPKISFSTPLVNQKYLNTCEDYSSLRRHFQSLSLNIAPEDYNDVSKNVLSDSESQSKPAGIDENTDYKANDSNESSGSFEVLMARLRPCSPVSSTTLRVRGDSSFIVSNGSESSDDLTFYHKMENLDLKRTINKTIKIRRRLLLKSGSESCDEESVSISRTVSSEEEQYDYQSKFGEIPSSPPLPLRNEEPTKATKSYFKETGNTLQDDVFSTLPFIYSLDSTGKSCPSSKHNRRRHPSAERFVKNFKKNRQELANRLYSIYNESIFDNKLPKDLKVHWNERLLKTAGQCIYMKRKVKNPDGSLSVSNEVKIELSGKVCTSAERVRNTLLHEACHAAVWLLHGVNDKHGRLWRAFVQRANITFPGLPPVTVRHTYAVEARFAYRCTGCFATINRHSKSLDIQRKVCGRCKSRFQLFVNKNGKMIPVKTTPTKPCIGQSIVKMTPRSKPVFAEFVKNHYKHVRGAASSHKDAMNKLGSMFHSMRLNSNMDKEN